jgi:hypothetical protein
VDLFVCTLFKKEVERDLQVLGVRRWRELVIEQSSQRAAAPTEEEEECYLGSFIK